MAKDNVYDDLRLVQDDSSHWYAIPADITSLCLKYGVVLVRKKQQSYPLRYRTSSSTV